MMIMDVVEYKYLFRYETLLTSGTRVWGEILYIYYFNGFLVEISFVTKLIHFVTTFYILNCINV